jgi:hypothetical protein
MMKKWMKQTQMIKVEVNTLKMRKMSIKYMIPTKIKTKTIVMDKVIWKRKKKKKTKMMKNMQLLKKKKRDC